MTLSLYNTLTRTKEPLIPENPENVRMYVCGPTVYDRAHLGNARSVVIYDVLFRLLRNVYGEDHVTYVRNITDVDDKINAAAVERKISIQALTQEMTRWFHEDMAALGCLSPSDEPRATAYIAQMITMTQRLIANGAAYAAEGHVLFDVQHSHATGWHYGMLSGRLLDDLVAGARVEVAPYKKHPGDFVLWKPASDKDDASSVFDSPWGKGRPGWHIECSAMATELLGQDFDIHGGGADLMFPHHENEIAQSCCAYPGSHFANMWVHNGFLTVNGEKMSKSLGNFITVRDLLEQGVHGEVIRFALLSTHYRKPLDWTEKLLEDSKKQLETLYRRLQATPVDIETEPPASGSMAVGNALFDDLNVPAFSAFLNQLRDPIALRTAGNLLGILQNDPEQWFKGEVTESDTEIEAQVAARSAAKAAKNWTEADRIRDELKAQGIILEDKPGNQTIWRRG